jgi:D-sedoheptulose 7-phosphate isomerase
MIDGYVAKLWDLTAGAWCSTTDKTMIGLDQGLRHFQRMAREADSLGRKLMFIGNGGSAAIASHMAIDYSKNGGVRSVSFNDAVALTCIANDLGYENVFSKQIEIHASGCDVLVAVSSSGRSPNIIAACAAARTLGCAIVTFSGFDEENPLRARGDINFYVNSHEYGFVEIAHLTLLHAVLDGLGRT